METKHMVQKLSAYNALHSPGSMHVSLGINWLFEPTINFYRQTHHIDWLIPANRNGLSPNDDYYYCFKDELHELISDQYTVIQDFPRINTVLVKNHRKQTP